MESPLVVIADSDPLSCRALIAALAVDRIDVRSVGSARDALALIDEQRPSLLVSELRLPDESGFALCRSIRERPEIAGLPCMLVSEWGEESDRILAFECGADDFLAKPIFPREFSARVRALLRRGQSGGASAAKAADESGAADLEIAADQSELRRGDERIRLTPRERALLEMLVQRRGYVLSREELMKGVWGQQDRPSDRNVDAHIKSLRRKLGPEGAALETVRGIGYRLREPGASRSGARGSA